MSITPNSSTVLETKFGRFAVDRQRDPKIFRHIQMDPYPTLEFNLSVIRAFVSREAVVVDAGAHIGTYGIPVSRFVKKVVAFEPTPKTFDCLAKNVELNAIKNIEIHNQGLAAENGFASLEPVPDGLATSQTLDVRKQGKVPVVTLDSQVKAADFIKMDVEGMEPQVLKGADALIRRSKPVILFEVNLTFLRQQRMGMADMQRFFDSHGYALWYPFEYRGKLCIGRVANIFTVTALINPGCLFFGKRSYNFDLIGLDKGRPLPGAFSVWPASRLMLHLVRLNVEDKLGRLKKLLRR